MKKLLMTAAALGLLTTAAKAEMNMAAAATIAILYDKTCTNTPDRHTFMLAVANQHMSPSDIADGIYEAKAIYVSMSSEKFCAKFGPEIKASDALTGH